MNRIFTKRHAFTLVELIAVLAGLVAIMGVSMGLLFAMLDFQQRHDERSEKIRSTNAFISQFRNDARAALAPFDLKSPQVVLVEWQTKAGKIRYRTESGEFPEQRNVIREVLDGEKIISTETYQLPDHTKRIWLEGDKDPSSGLVALNLWEIRPHTEVPNTSKLNSYTRTISDSSVNPNDIGYWRTIIVRTPQAVEQGQ